VTATLTETGAERSVTTGADGGYEIPELAVGTYNVTGEQTGFKKFVGKNVVVSIGHVAVVNITLQVGAAVDTIIVEANVAQVETTSTQLGAVMTDTAVRELPLNTRNAYALLQLQPGVQSQLGSDLFAGSDNPGAVSVNGGRGRSNNYMVNGGDGNDIFINAPAIQPSPDAIEEFRVLTNTFDAEYGRNSGSVVNVVTKSGTNQVHGDFYEFIRNDVLNTRGYFDNSVAPYKQNQFGGVLGGPIRKDRTFVFGSYEGNRVRQGQSSGGVLLPTAAEAAGDFSGQTPFDGTVADADFASILNARNGGACGLAIKGGAGAAAGDSYQVVFPNNQIPTACFDPTAAALYNLYVAPHGTGTISAVPSNKNRADQFTVRFDHRITGAQEFSAYYYFENDSRTDPFSTFQGAGSNVVGFGSVFGTRVQQWNLSHTWTIGSTVVNELRFNYFREGQGNVDHPVNILGSIHDSCGTAIPADECFQDVNNLITPNSTGLGITTNIPGHMGVPFVAVSGGFAIGNNLEGELPQVGNTFQWTDNLTKSYSKHTIKFGGDVRVQRFDQFLYFDINGSYTFSNLASADEIGSDDAYPNYFLGAANSYLQGAAQGENVRNKAVYLFAQDSFKLKNNLTLNYGLRWELNTPYYDVGNRLQTFRPGQVTTQYPCWLSAASAASLGLTPGDCGPNSGANSAVFPLGIVFPGDKGVPQGLTQTYYKAVAPRIGLAWSPGWNEGWLSKVSGGPGKTSVRLGFGIFYNPIEQLVLEQFSAEPPFGGSAALSHTLFNLPFLSQGGTIAPNVFSGIIHQTPKTPCFDPAGPPGCVDWSLFRTALLFGEFQPHLRAQYSEQYNLTIERQLTKDMMLRLSYVGTQAHRLLASYDTNAGNIQTCLDLINISNADPNSVLDSPGGNQTTCGPLGADSEYFIPANTALPSGLHLPYGPTGPTVVNNSGPNGIILVGTRPFSTPSCQPLSGSNMTGCPQDGVPVFSNIFAEDTIANSVYNALQVSVEKSYSHGLLFQASYTFSKAIDQAASFENELNSLNFKATRGLSLLDARHRFVFSPVWVLPIPKHEGITGKLINGWGASAIVIYQSGFPIRVQDGNDTELQSSFFFESANTPQLTGPITFTNPKNSSTQNIWFTGNFNDPPLGAFGNVPHALCCGPALSNTDLVISKKTPISEKWNTEFRAEFYNAWNHTQFKNPDGNFSDGLASQGGTFGLIQQTREGPRVIQFGLKILF
jgi:hypothetical protein